MNAAKFHEIIIPMRDAMFAEAQRILHDDANAHDAVQDVFEVLWRNRVRIRQKANPQGLCVHAVRNRCYEMLRRKSYEELQEWMQVDDTPQYDALQEHMKQMELLQEALDHLPRRQSQLVRMKYLEGKNIRQISETTGLKPSNVTTILSRATKMLKSYIAIEEFPRFRKLKAKNK